LTTRASDISRAAPVNWLKSSTPRSSSRAAAKFLGHQIHAVVQAADVAQVRGAIVASKTWGGSWCARKQDDGLIGALAEALVDARCGSLDGFVELAVALDEGAAGAAICTKLKRPV